MRPYLFRAMALAWTAPALVAAEPLMLPTVEIVRQQPALAVEPPALHTEVTAEELAAINSPDVSDALKYEPNLKVRKRTIGDRNALLAFRDMHSFQTPRALVLGDGLLLSNFLGAGWDTAPRWGVMQPEEIERVEVRYGPYSAEHSGNAMGGVVILHSRMPDDFEASVNAGAFAQSFDAYGTDDTYAGNKLHAAIGDRQGRWRYFLSANRLENDSQPQEFGIATPSGGTPSGIPVTGAHAYPDGGYITNSEGKTAIVEESLKFKLGVDFTDELQGRVTFAYLDRTEDRRHPETYLRDAAGDPVYHGTVNIAGVDHTIRGQRLGRSETRDLIYGAELEGALGNGWEIDSALSFYRVLEQTTRRSGTDYAAARANGPGTLTEDQGTGWQALDVKFGHRHDGGWLGQRLLLGYHFDRYVLDEASYDTANWRVANATSLSGDSEGKTRTHAVFVENEWQLGDPWTLTLGGRQEWWKAYDGALARDQGGARIHAGYPERSESRFSPKASLAFEPSHDWQATLSLGIAYRFPTVGELYQGALDNQGDFTASFDPDLKAERAFAKNLMLRRFFDGATVTVNLWENDVEDALFQQTNTYTGVRNYQNIDRVRSRGVELITAFYDLWTAGLDVDVNLSYTRAEILENAALPASEGSQFPRVPKWRANVFANYRVTERFQAGGGVRYADDPYDTLENTDGHASGFGYTDDYLVFDTRASYRLGKGFTMSGGIDNLTDERYYVYHPYSGRTFYAELAWRY